MIAIKGWFAEKHGIVLDTNIKQCIREHHVVKVLKETDKAVFAVCVCYWKAGVDILKGIWIPKSCLIPAEALEPSVPEQVALDCVESHEGDIFAASRAFASWCADAYL